MGQPMSAFVSGAIVMAYCVAALFFLRFRRDTQDRLFGAFAAAFLILAGQRALIAFLPADSPLEVMSYGLRIVAFSILILGIVDKNRRNP
jgi:amino acid transporter